MSDYDSPIYDYSKPLGTWPRNAAITSGVAAVLSACLACWVISKSCPHAYVILVGMAVAWALLPPVWFVCEFLFIFPSAGRREAWDAYKHGQQLAVAVWAAVTATLYALSESDLVEKDNAKTTCAIVVPRSVAPSSQMAIADLRLECEAK